MKKQKHFLTICEYKAYLKGYKDGQEELRQEIVKNM